MTLTAAPSLLAVLMSGTRKDRWKSREQRGLPPHESFTDALFRRGLAAQEYRRSYANVWRRLERGETPATCAGCGTELDVAEPCHDNRCEEAQ